MAVRFLRPALAMGVGAGLAAFAAPDALFPHREVHALEMQKDRHKVLIIGAGCAGTTVANQITRKGQVAQTDIAIVDPSKDHYYQPMWTMVGAGLYKKEDSKRATGDYLPAKAHWIQDSVQSFQPDANTVTLRSGRKLQYETLIVTSGLQINFDKIPGLTEALKDPSCPVGSIYDYNYAEKAHDILDKTKSGTAIFTVPTGTIKCGGAPQKVMWEWEAKWDSRGVRKTIDINFMTPGTAMFAINKYAASLLDLAKARDVRPNFGHELVSVNGPARTATFKCTSAGKEELVERSFDVMHVTPPMSSPDFIKQSPLAGPGGFVDVDKNTLQHKRYDNIFSLGDAAELPTSKTAAAISSQAPVVVHNLHQYLQGRPVTALYDGYTSCPILVGGGKLILAEFRYNQEISESFGFLVDQSKPSRWAYVLKRYVFPAVYWEFFLRGTWYGPRGWISPSFPKQASLSVPAAAA